MSAAPRLYFDDLVVDTVLETPAITVTSTHVALYAGLSQDLLEDPGVVPEELVIGLVTGLGWRVPQPPLAVVAFMGMEWRPRLPVRVGDTIYSRSRTVTKRQLREGGVVIEQREVINQDGAVAQEGRFTFMVARRPAADEAPAAKESSP
jgi:acyl dehydratase